jgi:hypothetical protein
MIEQLLSFGAAAVEAAVRPARVERFLSSG